MQITSDEAEMIISALYMRINFIETGTPTLCANDAVQQKKHSFIKPLEDEQRELLRTMRHLIIRLQSVH